MNKVFAMIIWCGLLLSPVLAWAQVRVFTCEPEWAALAVELGGQQVEAFSATTGLQDPHHVQARPSLIARVRKSDLLLCSGSDLEIGWLPLLLRRAGNPKLRPGEVNYMLASDYVRLLGKPKKLDRSLGDIHAGGNPHVQTSPDNILRVAKEFSARLQKVDSGQRDFYQQRFEDFQDRWRKALRKWKEQARPLAHLQVVVHHESWNYLEDWLRLEQIATLEDKPGVPPTSGHLAELLKQMESNPAKAILYAAYQDGRAAHWLSERTGIPAVKLPFTVGGTAEATDLFSLYDDTLRRLLEAAQ